MSRQPSKNEVAMAVHKELSRQSLEVARRAFSGAPAGKLSLDDARDLSMRRELASQGFEAIRLPPDLAKEWNRVNGW
jgi:hypothetical protein